MRPSRAPWFVRYPLTTAAAFLVALSIAAILAEIDFRFGDAGVLALHAVVVAATALSGASFVVASLRLMRDDETAGSVVACALVFVTAVAVAFGVFIPASGSWRLLTFPS